MPSPRAYFVQSDPFERGHPATPRLRSAHHGQIVTRSAPSSPLLAEARGRVPLFTAPEGLIEMREVIIREMGLQEVQED